MTGIKTIGTFLLLKFENILFSLRSSYILLENQRRYSNRKV